MKIPFIHNRLEKCRQQRVVSIREATRKLTDIPMIFGENTSQKLIIVNLYHFGILISNVHMAWMCTVAGRLKSDYSYSNTIVYNNFPWPTVTDAQKTEIEKFAQAILDASAEYPDSTLADMYGETSMLYHTLLLNVHRELDKAVMKLYGFPVKDFSEADCVAALMDMYQKLIGG